MRVYPPFIRSHGPFYTPQVPAHMPHMINKNIMSELLERYPKQWAATSSHRFRHPKDMQYGFAYFYYLIHRGEKLVKPPVDKVPPCTLHLAPCTLPLHPSPALALCCLWLSRRACACKSHEPSNVLCSLCPLGTVCFVSDRDPDLAH
jgi:hypothetical protein